MNKKVLIVLAVIILAVAYWLLSPLWRKVTLDERLPQNSETFVETASDTEVPIVIVKDDLTNMTPEMKAKFEAETASMQSKKMEKTEPMPLSQNKVVNSSDPTAPVILAQAPMTARAHDVEGKALFVQSGDKTYLRFENLKTINGPDLRIYLSANLGNEDIVDLGPIRATEGNVNYEIPAGTDITKYKNAIIWCRAFRVIFSYATL